MVDISVIESLATTVAKIVGAATSVVGAIHACRALWRKLTAKIHARRREPRRFDFLRQLPNEERRLLRLVYDGAVQEAAQERLCPTGSLTNTGDANKAKAEAAMRLLETSLMTALGLPPEEFHTIVGNLERFNLVEWSDDGWECGLQPRIYITPLGAAAVEQGLPRAA